MSGHGIDVCACGAVVRQCRCPGPHERRVVQKTCPLCDRVERAREDRERKERSEQDTQRLGPEKIGPR